VRVAIGGAARSPALWMMTGGWVVLCAADSVRALMILFDVYDGGSGPVDAFWLVSYALWGAATLHPSMGALTDPGPPARAGLTRGRLAALAVASLMAPAVLAIQTITGAPIDAPVIVAGCVAMLLLVLLRMSGLVREVEGKVLELRGTEARLRSSLAERAELAERLRHQAFHDELTGLANRSLFTERLEQALAAEDRERPPAVMLVDLDDFKLVNDTLGHVAGDELLVEVARRLRECLPEADTVARLGGDEFAALFTVEDAGDPSALAARVINALEAPVMLAGKQAFARASVGVAVDDGGLGMTELLRNADVAMYAAKGRGKSTYELFQPWMLASALDRHELVVALQEAIQREQFLVHYQPVVELDSGRVVGAEALVRWQRPGRGWSPPTSSSPSPRRPG
jgi:diguanylate cyclase (GGDEF)-like protein